MAKQRILPVVNISKYLEGVKQFGIKLKQNSDAYYHERRKVLDGFITLESMKSYLRVDYDDDDDIILSLIEASREYLKNATGKYYDNTNYLAVLYCKTLVYEWYKDRNLMESKKTSDKVRFSLASILLQLKYSDSKGDSDGKM